MGPTLYYLDTARMGRMTPRARQAQLDFTRLAGEEGGSALFDHFLRRGIDACGDFVRERYPGLASWRGIAELRESLRHLAGSDAGLPVLLANRSAQLMKLAARLLFRPCCNVLVTDLGWPPYHDQLCVEACRTGRAVTVVPVRETLVRQQAGEGEIIEQLRQCFIREKCDGLFLTAVSHLGIRLPVERIVRTLEAAAQVRFVVIDGAQDFCHVSTDLKSKFCDLYLAGSHKWLGSFHPLGLGFYGRRESRGFIETTVTRLAGMGDIDDPLLRFAMQLEQGSTDNATETVNLASLFSCQGAVADALERSTQSQGGLQRRQANAALVAAAAVQAGWQPLSPTETFRTGILLLQGEQEKTRTTDASILRAAFCERGVALTAYEHGIIRLSMPDCDWQPCEIDCLQDILQCVA